MVAEAPESSQATNLGNLNQQLLEEAWHRYRIYDRTANESQLRFTFLRRTILILGVTATFLAVSHSFIFGSVLPFQNEADVQNYSPWVMALYYFLRGAVIIMPIVVSILLAGAVKFDRGVNWILLRGSAEAVKRELYRYRANVGIYRGDLRDSNLSAELRTIGERLMKTQVNRAALKPRGGDPEPEIFSRLDADSYLNARLMDQLKWYRRKTAVLDRQWQLWQWLVYLFGGIGTFLAAIGLEVWVAVSNSVAAAFASYLEFRQLGATLTAYNQAASNLENILCWWHSLSSDARSSFENFEKLVENTEAVIQAESTGWVQEMRDALAGLYKEPESQEKDSQTQDEQSDDTRAPDNAGHGRSLPSQEPTNESDDAVKPVPRV
ncbi:DUF4231 domain-containing protein [Oculatella sp. LEGE 06141]|uniref:DUF4231 domain-containing protein n=1 Tax=Oculatella sp. LEGE 06141 TaxID=1828648 RepID=UPI00187F3293|nr:DUF4231 domain-containing protein [Oculatella sp. LEGE 06141]MBE9177608.1 DUF4231 domain-containing protein [Oculatella sp. LEGE 06141]